MLLEQPHLTIQHVELLANHFSVDNKHTENFIEWRSACLQGCDVGQERRRPLPPSASGNDVSAVDEADVHWRSHLPTPACSTSPEPVHSKSPPLVAHKYYRHHPLSVDTNHVASGGQGVNLPPSPASTISPHFPSCALQGSSNMSPTHANLRGRHSPEPLRVKHLPASSLHERLFSVKLSQLSSTPPSDPSEVLTEPSLSRLGKRKQIGSSASIAPLSAHMPSSSPSIPAPRTLREFEEAYAPTHARIERFLHNVERGKFAHIGLTPDMLKKTEN
jgi:hypothetical protein